ncbi:methyl-accepting chemotaxis protein [Vibrio navarrensis]|uniref:methyl-accepting chemotaxis protein n=1 Tax=Vibrio navarrensis TaxID=29495 RepID=UPI001869BB4F|nr:methyl-accepting chemotaxis protein [Vibrio navarrensis]EKA5634996.1 methyl-accepting chemotaxis protein [Vibrio navarrensis]MBE4618031.1 chemotaxis protein [Vibrio navarrensis]
MIRNIKIASRTIISFGFLSCICLLLGLYSIAQLSKLNDTTDVLTLQRMPAIVAAEKMRRMVLLSQISVTELSDAKSIEQQQNIKNTINALTREYDKNEADLNLLIKSQTAQAIFRDVRESHDKFIASLPRLFELTRNGEIDASLVYRDSTVKQNSLELRKLLDQLVDFQQSEAIKSNDAATASYKSSRLSLIIGLALTLSLVGFMAYFYSRSLIGPLRNSVQIAQRIANGDLTNVIADNHKDEAADMLRALNDMQTQLSATITKISESSHQLATTSEELSSVTVHSSEVLSQQHDKLNLAATAVSQLTSAIEEVARTANKTSDNAEIVDEKTQQGKVKVDQTIETVQSLQKEIQESEKNVLSLAEKVKSIVSVLTVIQGIAEQTNLLALNAAIEAARAGENGRGFAVVADEVRALAHRTQSSTKEIEEMISSVRQETEQTVTKMTQSSRLASTTLSIANDAGATFQEISVLISQINDQNAAVATATEEQATVAKDVDSNLLNIRDLSIQTQTGADQTSSSSSELARLAEHLNELVLKFKV